MGAGLFTLMAVVVGFDNAVGGTTSASGLSGVLLGGGNYEATYGGPPAWDASIAWPASSFGLTCGAACDAGTSPIKAAINVFNAPYQLDGQFLSGTPNAMSLMLSVEWPLAINVRAATLTFRSVGVRSVSGMFAGVVAPSELIDDVTAIAAGTGSLCQASALAAVTEQIAMSADIVATSAGLENVHGVACNAISFGVGFDADEIAIPAVGEVVTYDASTPVGCGD